MTTTARRRRPTRSSRVSSAGPRARRATPSRTTRSCRRPAAARRPTVSSTRDRGRDRDRDRERAAADDRGPRDGPAWERPRRYEAYPTIKTRAGLPGLPRLAVLAVPVRWSWSWPRSRCSSCRRCSASGDGVEPTRQPERRRSRRRPRAPTDRPSRSPTPQIYVIKSGDTLSRIAREFGLTLDELLDGEQGPRSSNPNRIAVGDEIIIPAPQAEEVPGESSAGRGVSLGRARGGVAAAA